VPINVAVILACAVRVIFPPARHSPAFALGAGLILGPLYFWMLVQREWGSGTLTKPLGELYQDAKQGRRRFRTDPIEWATAAAVLLNIFIGA
jgi:hypothetical protein